MGNTEEGKSSKTEKSYSATTDQNNVHVYPDWATMQAYYGPRLAVPPYLNSAVASPHAAPPYMWAPMQSVIPPYGAHYAAFYAHGGVYAHPGVPMGGAPTSMDAQGKSSGNTDGGFMKKLKEFDGLAMSMNNVNGDSAERGTSHRPSESDQEAEGSSDGSNGVTAVGGRSGKKRSWQGSPNSGAADGARGSEKKIEIENTSTALVVKDPSHPNVNPSPTSVPQLSMPSEAWLQNERELKRERRKQSNRESARRSRLRKQAETEELAAKVKMLTSENTTLRCEINKLVESSNKLRLENATLMEKLKDVQKDEVTSLDKTNDSRPKPIGTVNLLARVDNNDSTERRNENGSDSYERRSSGAKLHQLLGASPRTDAVAAG